jgi:hypothetical protein
MDVIGQATFHAVSVRQPLTLYRSGNLPRSTPEKDLLTSTEYEGSTSL